MSNKITFVLIWLLLSFPIVYTVNSNMKKAGNDEVYKTGFQLYLFVRAQFEVPKFYFITLLSLLIPKQK